ncbi:MAG: glycosyltransferase [Blastocatellia bacterium]
MNNCPAPGIPRAAFFTDAYHEVDGVAHTSRRLTAFARRDKRPFLCAHAGPETAVYTEGSVTHLALRRGPVSFSLDETLRHDLLLWRHAPLVLRAVRRFQPDVIHITGPGDLGQLGAWVAHRLNIPLVASWHTNVHQFGAARFARCAAALPAAARALACRRIENGALDAALRFYALARATLAPNEELRTLLAGRTGKPCRIMQRGVDTDLFSPAKRARRDPVFRLGFVGRLRPEKNVRFLARLEQALLLQGKTNFQFIIIGEGSERPWLEKHLHRARFTGVLRDEALARAYADLDLFVFPSRTDTFGNVTLEALAAGVPAVVTSAGGPKFIIEHGVSGHAATDDDDFIDTVIHLMSAPARLGEMRIAARVRAGEFSWDAVFEQVYDTWRYALATSAAAPAQTTVPAALPPRLPRAAPGAGH